MSYLKKLLVSLLIGAQAFAGLPPTTIKGQTDASATTKFGFQVPANQFTNLGGINALIETGNENLLQDPGMEAATSGWTASGGATATNNSTAKGTGAKGYDWDSNSASQTLVSAAITIPAGLKGKNGLAYCNIKTPSGTGTYTITVNDGTNDVVTAQTVTSSSTTFERQNVNFIFPSSGSIKIKLTSVASNEPEIYIDDCYMGDATNLTNVSQARLIDTVKVTGCSASWSVTNTSFTAFGTQTGCTYTSLNSICTTPSTNVPGIKCSSLAPGDYKIEYEGGVNPSTNTGAYYRFHDGTSAATEESYFAQGSGTSTISGTFRYTTPQSNITLSVQGKVASGTININGTTAIPGTFRVWYSPNSSQQAVSSANADYDWTSYTPTVTYNTGGATNVTHYGKHRRVGDTIFVEITSSFTGTPASFSRPIYALPSGLTFDTAKMDLVSSNTLMGYSMVKNIGSDSLSGQVEYASTSTFYPTAQLANGTYVSSTDITQAVPTTFGANKTIVVKVSGPISQWTGNQRAPTLVGSVTSNATGAERIERAYVAHSCTSSPCTIANQSGSWLTNITRTGTGSYSINYPSGTFSVAPTCTCTAVNTAANVWCQIPSAPSTTATSVQVYNNGGANDSGFNVVCMGPR